MLHPSSYVKKWWRFTLGCGEDILLQLEMMPPLMADLFIELFEMDRLQPISIRGCRAAIARIYKLIDAQWNPGTDGFHLELLRIFLSNARLRPDVFQVAGIAFDLLVFGHC